MDLRAVAYEHGRVSTESSDNSECGGMVAQSDQPCVPAQGAVQGGFTLWHLTAKLYWRRVESYRLGHCLSVFIIFQVSVVEPGCNVIVGKTETAGGRHVWPASYLAPVRIAHHAVDPLLGAHVRSSTAGLGKTLTFPGNPHANRLDDRIRPNQSPSMTPVTVAGAADGYPFPHLWYASSLRQVIGQDREFGTSIEHGTNAPFRGTSKRFEPNSRKEGL